MKKLPRKIIIYLVLIILLAAALRIVRAFEETRYSVDVYVYFQMAENWAYHGMEYYYSPREIPPLLPWVMAWGYNFGLTSEYTGLIIGVLLGALMPLAAFWIALNLFSVEEQSEEDTMPYVYALLAAFLVAVHPFLIRISVSCLREILYLPLMVFAMAFAVSAIRDKALWKWCVFAALTALANMTRREGIVVLVIFFVWQAVEFFIDREKYRKDAAYYMLISFLVLAVFWGLTLPVLYIILRDTESIWSPLGIPDIGILDEVRRIL